MLCSVLSFSEEVQSTEYTSREEDVNVRTKRKKILKEEEKEELWKVIRDENFCNIYIYTVHLQGTMYTCTYMGHHITYILCAMVLFYLPRSHTRI